MLTQTKTRRDETIKWKFTHETTNKKAQKISQTSISARNTESLDLEETYGMRPETTEHFIWDTYDGIGMSPL